MPLSALASLKSGMVNFLVPFVLENALLSVCQYLSHVGKISKYCYFCCYLSYNNCGCCISHECHNLFSFAGASVNVIWFIQDLSQFR